MVLKFWQKTKWGSSVLQPCQNVREDKGGHWSVNVRTSYRLPAGPWSMCNVLLMRLSCGWVDMLDVSVFTEKERFPGCCVESQIKRVGRLSCVNRRLSGCAFDPGSSAASPAFVATVRREETSHKSTVVPWDSLLFTHDCTDNKSIAHWVDQSALPQVMWPVLKPHLLPLQCH